MELPRILGKCTFVVKIPCWRSSTMVSCLQCGAYDDRYCGCWRDRIPGFAVSDTFVPSVDFTVLSPTNNRRTHRQHHATPILPNLDVSATSPSALDWKLRGVRGGESPRLSLREARIPCMREVGGNRWLRQ